MNSRIRFFNENDWDAFSGAESWSESAPPLIVDVINKVGMEFQLIGDRTGIEATWMDENENVASARCSIEGPLWTMEVVMTSLVQGEDELTPEILEQLGFQIL